MITIDIDGNVTVSLPKANTSFAVAVDKLPSQTLVHIFNYGLRQILNDAMAPAKTPEEASGLAQKRLDNLYAGTLRAAPNRSGNAVERRAKELAATAVEANASFLAWVGKNGLKKSDKVYRDQVAKQVAKALTPADNRFTAQAKVDVDAAKALGDVEIEL